MTRQRARELIIQRANRNAYRAKVGSPYRMKHLHQAVARCRRFHLVPVDVLIAAGFNPTSPTHRSPR